MYKSYIHNFYWNNDFPLKRIIFEHYVKNGYVVFENDRKTIINWDNEYYVYNNGKWLGPFGSENEARFWIRALP